MSFELLKASRHHILQGNSQSAESSDSGSAQNTISQLESESPVSRKDDYSELFSEKKQHQQQEQMIPTVSSKTEIATAGNHQSRDQDKVLFLNNTCFFSYSLSPAGSNSQNTITGKPTAQISRD